MHASLRLYNKGRSYIIDKRNEHDTKRNVVIEYISPISLDIIDHNIDYVYQLLPHGDCSTHQEMQWIKDKQYIYCHSGEIVFDDRRNFDFETFISKCSSILEVGCMNHSCKVFLNSSVFITKEDVTLLF